MDLQSFLNSRNMSKYQLSKISGVPKTTIMDICAGRSEISRCSAGTVQRLAKALDCTMESMMELSVSNVSGQPKDDGYLEYGLPAWLRESVSVMQKAWSKLDAGEKYIRWDCDFCNLQTDINNAEVNELISAEQAWYLRKKYLRMERG